MKAYFRTEYAFRLLAANYSHKGNGIFQNNLLKQNICRAFGNTKGLKDTKHLARTKQTKHDKKIGKQLKNTSLPLIVSIVFKPHGEMEKKTL